EALEEHLAELGVRVDDLLHARDIMNGGRADHWCRMIALNTSAETQRRRDSRRAGNSYHGFPTRAQSGTRRHGLKTRDTNTLLLLSLRLCDSALVFVLIELRR